MTASRIKAHVWIEGQVQGVGFRASTRQQAHRHQIDGWVRNLSDGRVEAVFQGEKPQVESIVQWCRKGPSAASVTGIHVEYEPLENLEEFRVTST
jgi:acylphosphatase